MAYKMHPKPQKRFFHGVEEIRLSVGRDYMLTQTPVNIRFSFENGSSQKLIMSDDDARALVKMLNSMIEG